MKKNYNSKSLMKSGFSLLCRALDQGLSMNKFKVYLRNFVNSYYGLNRPERYDLYNELYVLYRAARNNPDWHKKLALRSTYDQVLRVARRVERQKKTRDKQSTVRMYLQNPNQIFFLCSIHDHPAEDHKMWQGLIYVDRFWRQKVSGQMYYAVLSYIKNRKIQTIQWVMHDPVWMTTRPNCKHFFIPLDTATVLHTSPKALLERHRYKFYTVDDYYDLRSDVYGILNSITPCSEFEKKAKR